MAWRTYQIKPAGGSPEEFYAPDLDTAFGLARARWPFAKSWECVG